MGARKGQAVLRKLDALSVECRNGVATGNSHETWRALESTRELPLGEKKWNVPWLAKGVEENAKRWEAHGISGAEKEMSSAEEVVAEAKNLPSLSLKELHDMCL